MTSYRISSCTLSLSQSFRAPPPVPRSHAPLEKTQPNTASPPLEPCPHLGSLGLLPSPELSDKGTQPCLQVLITSFYNRWAGYILN